MKTSIKWMALLIAGIIIGSAFRSPVAEPEAVEIIQKANELRYGETSVGTMQMTVIRPSWSRSISMKMWTKGTDYSMVLITAPAREKGQVFMKRKTEMWNWIPSISRLIKLPPSTMSQGWMGSDYTNDDMINEGALVTKFNHKILRSEQFNNMDCWVIESTPKPNTAVIWGKKLSWISKDGYFTLKTESYDEDMYLVKTQTASKIKEFSGKRLPSFFEVIPADEPGHKTEVELLDITYNTPIEESFFSQQNMKRVR